MLAGLRKFFSQLTHWKGLFAKLFLKTIFLGLLGFLKRAGRRQTEALQKTAGPSKKGGFRIREFQLWRDSYFMDRVRGLMKTSGKPILLVTFLPGLAVRMTRRFHQPIFGNPERAVGAMSGLMQYGRFLNEGRRESLQAVFPVSRKETWPEFSDDLPSLDELQGKKILARYGIPTVREGFAADRIEVLRLAGEIGYPLALKIHSPAILHKTDLGGVILKINHEEELIKSISSLEAKFPELHDPAGRAGFLVQEMVPEGVEVLLGMISDPQFGPLLVLGLGGILVEVLKDVVFARPPLTELQAERLWTSLRGAALFSEFRGRPPADLQALITATVNFSYLIKDLKDIFKEIDVNPLMVLGPGKGVKALDALFIKK
jgi:acetyltransferase